MFFFFVEYFQILHLILFMYVYFISCYGRFLGKIVIILQFKNICVFFLFSDEDFNSGMFANKMEKVVIND